MTTPERQLDEASKCLDSPYYFIYNYVKIQDALLLDWIPFNLWDPQEGVLQDIQNHRLLAVLKARQIGLTWLVLAFILWRMIFRPGTIALIFSKRDDEAIYLLDERLKGMFKELPEWLRHGIEAVPGGDSKHIWRLTNGSECRAYTPEAGDTYTATIVFVDEADLIPSLNKLMRSAKPTIDAGGWMILVSRVDKSRPNSEFKKLYRAARKGENAWFPIFLPWHARPGRTREWHKALADDIQSRTGSFDDLHEQYPETDAQALAPRSADKRVPAAWLLGCWDEQKPIPLDDIEDAPPFSGLRVYQPPVPGVSYVLAGDPAEGLPTSDDSALTVFRVDTGEQVAALNEKLEPKVVFPNTCAGVARWYNYARLMIERNNHGHAVIGWLEQNARDLEVLNGHDGRPGWSNSPASKARLWDVAAAAYKHTETTLVDFESHTQVASIEKATLKAPEGDYDDLAVVCALAQLACGQVAAMLPPIHGSVPMIGVRTPRQGRMSLIEKELGELEDVRPRPFG